MQAQVTGVLHRVAFKEGDEVKQGQVLFQLDARPYRAALEQASALLERDRAQATNAAAGGKTLPVIGREGVRHLRSSTSRFAPRGRQLRRPWRAARPR